MSKTIEISRELAERLTKDYTGRPNWDALEEDRLAATEELRAILAAPAVERQEPVAWFDGAPTSPWASEWFIAVTTYGERVVLRELPEGYTYDFTTADKTYLMRDRIKKWMQFPDSDFVPFSPPAPVAVVLPSKQEISSLVWNEVLKAEAISGVSCFNAAEFAVEAVISLIKELNP